MPRHAVRSSSQVFGSFSPVCVLALALAPVAVHAQLGLPGAQLFQQGAGGVPGAPAALEQFGAALAAGDFDGDGALDLAIGSPRESIAPVSEAGTVTVVMGAADGLDGAGSVLFDLNGPAGLTAGTGDRFGTVLAAGDFDGDGFDDLAVGIPSRDVISPELNVRPRAGAVLVLHGGPGGLVEAGAQYWRQGADGVTGALEEDDYFGAALVAGDFNDDGFDDLAVGVPGEDVGAVGSAGAVNVIYGGVSGLDADGPIADSIWTQGDLGTSQDEANDQFGSTLAAGDFNGDGISDLAIGAPDETWIAEFRAGAVFVVPGSAAGLSALGDQVVTQPQGGNAGGPEAEDRFGGSLAAADLDGDGVDDLVIGSPGEAYDLPAGGDAGSEMGVVTVFPGVAGLGVSSVALASLDRLGVAGGAASGDRFGSAVAVADLGGDARAELIVGAPGVEIAGQSSAGEIRILTGLDPISSVPWSQDGDVPGVVELGDGFGETLAAGDFDGDGFADLAVGLPAEDVGETVNAGAVNTLYASGLFRDGFESSSTGNWSSAAP